MLFFCDRSAVVQPFGRQRHAAEQSPEEPSGDDGAGVDHERVSPRFGHRAQSEQHELSHDGARGRDQRECRRRNSVPMLPKPSSDTSKPPSRRVFIVYASLLMLGVD